MDQEYNRYAKRDALSTHSILGDESVGKINRNLYADKKKRKSKKSRLSNILSFYIIYKHY